MIAWVDCETSGLFEREGHLLEVAFVITDDELNEVAFKSLVCKPVGVEVREMVEKMDPYVRNMHTKNGLIEDLFKTSAFRRYEAEVAFVDFCTEAFKNEPGVGSHRCLNCKLNAEDHKAGIAACENFEEKMDPAIKHTPLAGSTVPFDRKWLHEHMPKLEGLFSHRHLDVSTFTEAAKRWAPEVYKNRPRSTDTHRALADVRGSIEIMKYYLEKR